MPVIVRSFAKVNLGLRIGALRPDGFHELRTVYQTVALHDIIRVQVSKGTGVEIRCHDPRVPTDSTNTCYRIADRVMEAQKARGRVVIEIEKRLPVQGGLGGASANAVATLLALERVLKKALPGPEKFRIAAEVGSDLPLFLIGGAVLGVGRGEEVYPLPDLPPVPCVIALPDVAVSTPKAFAAWDAHLPQGLKPLISSSANGTAEAALSRGLSNREGHDFSRAERAAEGDAELRSAGRTRASAPTDANSAKLTVSSPSDRISEFSRMTSAWLNGEFQPGNKADKASSGVPGRSRGRAENPLLDLVRTGIENDFERVVFPQYPELREVKQALERAGAFYASLSGSGSAIYGLFPSKVAAKKAALRLRKEGISAVTTATLSRRQYWQRIFD